ncbi:MAG: F0F1 ATP synthase subunit delta [Bacteroidota bacterium]
MINSCAISGRYISTVKLTTAVKMTPEAIEKIKSKLKGSSALDENIEIQTVVDPDILGGFVLEFDNQLYDASVAHKLEELKKEFSKNLFVRDF